MTNFRWWRLQTITRSVFDYPKRKVTGVEGVLGPSIERNFVKDTSRNCDGGHAGEGSPELDEHGLEGQAVRELELFEVPPRCADELGRPRSALEPLERTVLLQHRRAVRVHE